jgi:hypothetical protein
MPPISGWAAGVRFLVKRPGLLSSSTASPGRVLLVQGAGGAAGVDGGEVRLDILRE